MSDHVFPDIRRFGLTGPFMNEDDDSWMGKVEIFFTELERLLVAFCVEIQRDETSLRTERDTAVKQGFVDQHRRISVAPKL